ncbi:MAG: hypothetical protein IPI49_32755 [Myxococcales bacterium]|nr:hypothetical protein [Myxococcales bacterium]HRC55096.1 hypothetical protein [Kofleriaceae bacterium]
MFKLLIGILKGSILGGALGYGAYALGQPGAWFAWVTYGVIGALVGLVVGRPLWSLIADKNATSFAAILKAIFGAAVAIGLYALARKFGSGVELTLLGETRALPAWQPIMGAAIGGLWGGIIELDDAFDDPPAKPARKQLDKGK